MADPKPLDGNDVYEKLGVSKTQTREEILNQANKLKNKKKSKLRGIQGRGNQDSQEYTEETDKLLEIRDAIEKIENNHPEDGYEPPKDLSLSVLTSNPEVQNSVEFKVTSNDGPENNATVEANGQAATTSSDGKAKITFQSAGSFTASAQKPGNYNNDSTSVTVSPRTVDLTFSDCPRELEVEERKEIKITDAGGNGIGNIDISSDGTNLATTGNSGTATVSFSSKGNKQIKADAPDTSDVTYKSAQETVTVTPKSLQLNLQVSSEPVVGEEIIFRVTSDEGTEEDVVIDAANGPTVTTGPKGKAPVEFEAANTFNLTLSKDSDDPNVTYEDESVQVTVGRGDANLTVGETDGEFIENKEVAIRIVDDDGNGVPGVTVTTNHSHDEETDDKGWVDLTLQSDDDLKLSAEKDSQKFDYDGVDEAVFIVGEYTPDINFQNVPDTGTAGETVAVKVVDENNRGLEGVVVKSAEQASTWTTDADGEVKVTLMDRPGIEVLTADKPNTDFRNGMAEESILIQA